MTRKGKKGEVISQVNVKTGKVELLTILSSHNIKYGFLQYNCLDSKGNKETVLDISLSNHEKPVERHHGNGKVDKFFYKANW